MKGNEKIWLIGSGYMAIEFAKVLHSLGNEFVCVGRGVANAEKFTSETGVACIPGGIEEFLKLTTVLPESVLVAVSVEELTPTVTALLKYGVKNILVEKPGVGIPDEIVELNRLAKEKKANVFVAYNRRFFASVIAAQNIIEKDGGVTSFAFEFTEWSHKIKDLQKHPVEHNYWFLGNSTHVIDTAFFLAGKPDALCSFVKGRDKLSWHPASSVYAGAGETGGGALFSYHANWQAPGRWVIEILTTKHRLLFKPLEKLQIQQVGSVEVNMVNDIDYSLDEKFKPGVFIQLQKFLGREFTGLCSLEEQAAMMPVYKKMAGYQQIA